MAYRFQQRPYYAKLQRTGGLSRLDPAVFSAYPIGDPTSMVVPGYGAPGYNTLQMSSNPSAAAIGYATIGDYRCNYYEPNYETTNFYTRACPFSDEVYGTDTVRFVPNSKKPVHTTKEAFTRRRCR